LRPPNELIGCCWHEAHWRCNCIWHPVPNRRHFERAGAFIRITPCPFPLHLPSQRISPASANARRNIFRFEILSSIFEILIIFGGGERLSFPPSLSSFSPSSSLPSPPSPPFRLLFSLPSLRDVIMPDATETLFLHRKRISTAAYQSKLGHQSPRLGVCCSSVHKARAFPWTDSTSVRSIGSQSLGQSCCPTFLSSFLLDNSGNQCPEERVPEAMFSALALLVSPPEDFRCASSFPRGPGRLRAEVAV